jgi:hypothetical protein
MHVPKLIAWYGVDFLNVTTILYLLHFPGSHTRDFLMSFQLIVLFRSFLIDYHSYRKDISIRSLILFSASECATVHYTWRVAEYPGGNSPWCSSHRDPHIWRSVLQLGQNCLFRHRDTVGLWKYHNGICDVGIEWSAEQSEVRNLWL